MRLCVAVIFTIFVFCASCDPTRAAPSRAKRQGWNWGGENDDSSQVSPTRPTPTRPTPTPTAATQAASSTENAQQCMSTCRVTPEYNPVCGSNRVTYENIGRLNCAKKCGVDVERLFTGTCSPAPPPEQLR